MSCSIIRLVGFIMMLGLFLQGCSFERKKEGAELPPPQVLTGPPAESIPVPETMNVPETMRVPETMSSPSERESGY